MGHGGGGERSAGLARKASPLTAGANVVMPLVTSSGPSATSLVDPEASLSWQVSVLTDPCPLALVLGMDSTIAFSCDWTAFSMAVRAVISSYETW